MALSIGPTLISGDAAKFYQVLAPEKVARNSKKKKLGDEMLRGGLLPEILWLALTSEPNALNSIQGSRLLPKWSHLRLFFESVRVKIWRGRTCASALL